MLETHEEGLELSYWATISSTYSRWDAPEEADVLSEPLEIPDTGLSSLLVSRDASRAVPRELVAQTAANSERGFSFAFLLPSKRYRPRASSSVQPLHLPFLSWLHAQSMRRADKAAHHLSATRSDGFFEPTGRGSRTCRLMT